MVEGKEIRETLPPSKENVVCKFRAAVKGRVSGTELMQPSEVMGKAEAGAQLENLIGCVLNKRKQPNTENTLFTQLWAGSNPF